MINIQDKSKCCGCSACLHICPKCSISFKEDREGFLYPELNKKTCVDCGLCEKVCPFLNQNDERLPLKVFAAKHPDDEIRMSSSSGGIFTLLAEQVIDEGGVVFGAKFNENWEVIHDFTETKDGLTPFRGSKYVQSRIGGAYAIAEGFLKSGRKVMFTGTPCQIAGLKKYLRKEYDNLLTVDFVCHGVPSPMVWRKYLSEELQHHKDKVLKTIEFRDKSIGWKKFSFVLKFDRSLVDGENRPVLTSVFYENPYMRAFLSNLSLRPSCYACPAKSGKSGADITIGDFWGIDKVSKEIDDDRGISLCLLHNPDLHFDVEGISLPYESAVLDNSCIEKSVNVPINRDFFMTILRHKRFSNALHQCNSSNLFYRVKRALFRKINCR